MTKQQRSPAPAPDLLTSREVAHRLSVGVRTLWRMVDRGEVPAPIRFNRRLALASGGH